MNVQPVKSEKATIKKQFNSSFRTNLGSIIPVVRGIEDQQLQVHDVDDNVDADQDEPLGGEQIQQQGG